MMKNGKVIWLGMVFVLLLLMADCSGDTPTLQSEEPGSAESVVTEEPVNPEGEATPASEVVEENTKGPATSEEENDKTVSVTFNSSVHSSDLGGYAWIQEYLSSNDLEAADAKLWSESARAGAVCYPSSSPASKSAPSAADGSFSVTFEAEPGSSFRIMCDPDETHPAALGIDEFAVPEDGGTIDHATSGYLYPGMWTPELGIANDLAAKAAGYTNAEEMFQSAGTCRALALPGESTKIAVSEGEAYGFYMEAPNTAGRVTLLTEESGAYIVIKEFGEGESETEIEIEFTDTSGSGLAWPTATCPIKKSFSTHLEVPPFEVAADFTLTDGNGNMVNLANELQEHEQVVLVFYYSLGCGPCMAQIIQIENDQAKYEELDAQVLFIAVQNELTAKINAKHINAHFPILADNKGNIAEAFGVLENGGLSTPSVFIINKHKQIVWGEISHIEGSGCGKERVPSQTILENLQ